MSGGSFDYLFCETPEAPALLTQMIEEAETEGFDKGAAVLRDLLATFEVLGDKWEEASEFMRVFEWWRSGDYGPAFVEAAEAALVRKRASP